MMSEDDGGRSRAGGPFESTARRSAALQCGGLRTLALLGSHGQRAGGVATFTVDLGAALVREWPALEHLVIAVNDLVGPQAFTSPVRFAIAPSDVSAYRRAADFLNASDVDLVSVIHEDGLHGGAGGGHLLAFLRELRMPVVTTLRAIQPEPGRVEREVIAEILRRSDRVVVTSARDANLLRQVHGIDADKVDHIPGGGDRPLPAVARAYGRCFERARAEHAQRRWRSADAPSLLDRVGGLPPLDLAHVIRLTDELGVRGHADSDIIARGAPGHRLDDNAAALALMAMLEEAGADDQLMESVLASRYLAFLGEAFDRERGRFRAGLLPDRRWADVATEDSHARALWALGVVVGRGRDHGRCELASELFRAAAPACEDFSSLRAIAYALLALAEFQRSFTADLAVTDRQRMLLDRLRARFVRVGTPERPWFEDRLGSEMARQAQAMLVVGERLGDDEAVAIGARSLAWLASAQRGHDDVFEPLGTDGIEQRPADAMATVSACLAAMRVIGDGRWADEASRAFGWFLGGNSARRPLYDARSGGTADAIRAHRVDARQSAEATLAFLLAATEIRVVAGADRIPTQLRPAPRGTGSHDRHALTALDSVDTARADGHTVAGPHASSDPER